MDWIEKYKPNRWDVVRVSGRAMHRFAIMFVLMVAAGEKTNQFSSAHDIIVKNIKRVRGLWFSRVKELISSKLWVPGKDVTRTAATLTARRCLFCRPTCVFYKRGNQNCCRPCNRTKFCPFCWARIAAYTYWHVRKYLNTRRKTATQDCVTCVVSTLYVPAQDFDATLGMQLEAFGSNAKILRDIIQQYTTLYGKKAKSLQRLTTGSMWSLVIEPWKTGWRVESRQFVVARCNSKFPVIALPTAQTKYCKTAPLNTFVRSTKLLGRFVKYPKNLLTSYVELTAVAVVSSSDVRLRRGTGRFRKCGSSLRVAFKEINPPRTAKGFITDATEQAP